MNSGSGNWALLVIAIRIIVVIITTKYSNFCNYIATIINCLYIKTSKK